MMKTPGSVVAYCTDRSTKLAVDLLLAKKRPQFPEDLKWNELPDFYRANLAAYQVRIEFALFLNRVWDEVWSSMPEPWAAASPHDPGDRAVLSWDQIWDEDCFAREYTKGAWSCQLSVLRDDSDGLQLAFGIWQNGESIFGELDTAELPKSWELDGDHEYGWTDEGMLPITATVDLSSLKKQATVAQEFIAKQTA